MTHTITVNVTIPDPPLELLPEVPVITAGSRECDICAALVVAHGEDAPRYQAFWEMVHRVLKESTRTFSDDEVPPTFLAQVLRDV